MSYRDCSTCAYSEMHEYLDTFYCRNRDCVMHTSHDFQEICGCEHWESKDAFKRGGCSECRFGEYNAETDTFTCHSKDTRHFTRSASDREHREHRDCCFCSPKEAPKPKEPQQAAEETNLFTSPVQKSIQLYCVRYSIEDRTRRVRMEFLVNAISSEEADALARECFAKIAYEGERITGGPEFIPVAEKGVLDYSRMYL